MWFMYWFTFDLMYGYVVYVLIHIWFNAWLCGLCIDLMHGYVVYVLIHIWFNVWLCGLCISVDWFPCVFLLTGRGWSARPQRRGRSWGAKGSCWAPWRARAHRSGWREGESRVHILYNRSLFNLIKMTLYLKVSHNTPTWLANFYMMVVPSMLLVLVDFDRFIRGSLMTVSDCRVNLVFLDFLDILEDLDLR
jgi:hypothetical protein